MKYKYFTWILFLTVWTSCSKNSDRISNELTFATRDDSELFFKNIRQSNYDLQEEKDAKINIFRHKERNDSAWLNVAIAHNWRADQAFVMIEWKDTLKSLEEILLFTNDPKRKLYYRQGNVRMQTQFAREVYNVLSDGYNIYMLYDQDTLSIYSDPQDEEVFRTVMKDYFRLTGMDQ